jgi:ATP-dependent HslUV protease subunit HslV
MKCLSAIFSAFPQEPYTSMTVAVAVRKGGQIVLAADTQNNFGHNRAPISNHRTQKILTVGDNHLATSGWGLYANILDDFLARKRPPKLDSERDVFRFFQAFWKALHEQYSLVNDQCQAEEERSPFGDLYASFLLVNGGGIFYVSSDTSVTAFEQYYAVGSGAEFALGALHALYDTDLDAETIARRACAAAMAFNVYCGGEVDVCRVAL